MKSPQCFLVGTLLFALLALIRQTDAFCTRGRLRATLPVTRLTRMISERRQWQINHSCDAMAVRQHAVGLAHLGLISGKLCLLGFELDAEELVSSFQDVCLQLVQQALVSQTLLLRRSRWKRGEEARGWR